jgi:Prp8 binding protein
MPGVDFKRPAENVGALVPAKKAKTMDVVASGASVTRTSNLLAPIMLLQGHEGEIYSAKFSPDGSCLASGVFDQKNFFLERLWRM